MHNRTMARCMLGWCLGAISLSAIAQIDPTALPQPSDGLPLGAESNTLILELGDSQKLRAQLADPEQRAAILADRLEQQRKANPELARVLRLDTATEQKLLALLVDQQLADELRPGRFAALAPTASPVTQQGLNPPDEVGDLLELEAQDYEEHMRAVGNLFDAAQVDAYLDYVRLRPARSSVEQFNRTLPTAIALSSEQKDALVPVFADNLEKTAQSIFLSEMSVRRLPEIPLAQRRLADSGQRSQLFNVAIQEQLARRLALVDRELLQRAAPILSREQAAVYAQQLAQQLTSLRDQTRRMRRALGIAAEQVLEPAAPAPQLPATTQLELRLRINDTEIVRTLTSKHGAAAKLEGPAGLWVEAQPSLSVPDISIVELRFYETSSNGRRLVGSSSNIGVTGIQPPAASQDIRANRLLLRGRKAYRVDWNVSVTYL